MVMTTRNNIMLKHAEGWGIDTVLIGKGPIIMVEVCKARAQVGGNITIEGLQHVKEERGWW